RVLDELAGRGLLRRHVREQVADRLMLPDLLAEALPLLRVTHRVLERGPAHTDRPRGHLDPADLQAPHHLGEPLALDPAEQRRTRNPHPVEGQLTALHALVAELGQVPTDLETRTFLHEQDADAAVR